MSSFDKHLGKVLIDETAFIPDAQTEYTWTIRIHVLHSVRLLYINNKVELLWFGK